MLAERDVIAATVPFTNLCQPASRTLLLAAQYVDSEVPSWALAVHTGYRKIRIRTKADVVSLGLCCIVTSKRNSLLASIIWC